VGPPRTYTLSELEDRSGFDKRTIAYYIQESLLPKVGRRGPKTRYPQDFLDRLMFIRRVRDLQDAGKLRAVTLSEISDVMAGLSAEDIRRGSKRAMAEAEIRDMFPEPDFETTQLSISAAENLSSFGADLDSDLGLRLDAPGTRVPPDAETWSDPGESFSMAPASKRRETLQTRLLPPEPDAKRSLLTEASEYFDGSRRRKKIADELGRLVRAVDERARHSTTTSSSGPNREQLTRVAVTEDIILSVRNIDDKDVHLVEELAEVLRRAGKIP
jgi:DNA-binding transcriptional MerR regulator